MLVEGIDYFVHLVPFPHCGYDGAVMPNDDGTFSIYIDSNADDEHRRTALEHELNHIRLDHFYSEKPRSVLEEEAELGRVISSPDVVPEKAKEPAVHVKTIQEYEDDAERWIKSWRQAMKWADLMRDQNATS